MNSMEKESELWKESNDKQEREGKWEGLKNEAVTYKNYLPFWKAIMMSEKVGNVKISGKLFHFFMDLWSLVRILFYDVIIILYVI